jgi:2-hydroxy-3-keto-5-methylthiopentenyl-1-phosphate phosphatase
MWKGVNISWESAISLLKDVPLDPKFPGFLDMLCAFRLPLTVVSAGLTPLCRLYLDQFLPKLEAAEKELEKEGSGKKMLTIMANEAEMKLDGWDVIYRDASEFGNDKGAPIRELRRQFENEEER